MKKQKYFYYLIIVISFLIITGSTVSILTNVFLTDTNSPAGFSGQLQNGKAPPQGGAAPDNMPDMSVMQEARQILQEANGNITEEVKQKLYDLGLSDEQIEMFSRMQQNRQGGQELPQRGDRSMGNIPGTRKLPVVQIILIVLSLGAIGFSGYRLYRISNQNKPTGGSNHVYY